MLAKDSEVVLGESTFLSNVAGLDGAAIMSVAGDVALVKRSQCRLPLTVDIDWRDTNVECNTDNATDHAGADMNCPCDAYFSDGLARLTTC